MKDCIRQRRALAALLVTLGSLLVGAPPVLAVPTSTATFTTSTTPTLRINEVLASNTRIANGTTFPDLIELYNAGPTAIDLTGKVLTDQAADPTNPTRFVFPAGATIAAGGYLVVFADSATGSGYHTGFSLDAEGDEVKLYDSVAAANANTPLDSIKFGFQVPDLSLSRTGAASNVWALTTPTMTATAGAANGAPIALGTLSAAKINEWAGNIVARLDHDMIELYNPNAQPIAITGVRLTDNIAPGQGFTFPSLSFIGPTGFLALYKGDYLFGLNGDRAVVTLLGENSEQIDQITLIAQPNDQSQGRSPDGSANIVTFAVPSPGISNTTPFPAAYNDLLNNLRITEFMYDPSADSNASQFEFIELQNTGASTLNLGGVRFTNGIDYDFPAGTTLAPGAFIVVANDRSSFLSRYPAAAGVLAPGGFNGSFANDGETIALTLPAPWKVHIQRFVYRNDWYASTSRGGFSLVAASLTATPSDWSKAAGWRASATVNGNPGAADPGTTSGSSSNARLANLSVRTTLAAGQNLIVGFFVGGGSRNILVRAAGPGLTALGVPGAMADPHLDLYSGSTLVLSNEDWAASLAPTFASVGAFAFPANSKDAAFVQGVTELASVHTRGPTGGIVLVEAYDTGGTSGARLVNVSARNRVGTGDDVLIAGFNISGTGGKQLLFRAVGPKLATFGVTGTLADPKLEVYTAAGVKLTENDNWAGSLAPTFAAVGAFALDANSKDAALLTTLAAGNSYTVIVRGADGGTGEALVEIYEGP